MKTIRITYWSVDAYGVKSVLEIHEFNEQKTERTTNEWIGRHIQMMASMTNTFTIDITEEAS